MLTEKQNIMVAEAIGNGLDWPKMTNDPQVNCAVDVLVCNMKPWEKLTEETRDYYRKEVEGFKPPETGKKS